MRSIIRNIVMSPWWLVQVFSQAKSFTANPILGNRWLNRLGLHVGRMVVAHAARRVRLLFIAPFVEKDLRQAYWHDGFVIIEDFLPDDQFAQINSSVRENGAQFEVRECIQGDTLTHRVLLDEAARAQLPALKNLMENRRYLNLLAFVGATYKKTAVLYSTNCQRVCAWQSGPTKNLAQRHVPSHHESLVFSRRRAAGKWPI